MKLKDTLAANSFDYAYLTKRIYKYIKPYLFRIILGFLIALPVGALDGVIAYALKPYMDEVLIKKNMLLAYIIPFGIVAFAALQGLLRYLNDYLTNWTGQKVTNDVKLGLFKKLVQMDAKFYDENSSGIILTRYLTDPDTASKGILDNLKALMSSGIGALALIGVMLYNSWELALVGVIVLCIAFLPAAIIRKRIKSASNKTMKIGGNIMTDFNETTQGNKIVASYNLADYQFSKFSKEIRDSFDVNMSLVKRVAWMSPIMYTIASVGIAIVMAFGTYLVGEIKKAEMSQEEFYTAVGIKKPYFYNLLTATPPPTVLQDKIAAVLDEKTGADDVRRRQLYDLAAEGRSEIPADIAKLIKDNPAKLDMIRETLNKLLAAQG